MFHFVQLSTLVMSGRIAATQQQAIILCSEHPSHRPLLVCTANLPKVRTLAVFSFSPKSSFRSVISQLSSFPFALFLNKPLFSILCYKCHLLSVTYSFCLTLTPMGLHCTLKNVVSSMKEISGILMGWGSNPRPLQF